MFKTKHVVNGVKIHRIRWHNIKTTIILSKVTFQFNVGKFLLLCPLSVIYFLRSYKYEDGKSTYWSRKHSKFEVDFWTRKEFVNGVYVVVFIVPLING